MTPDDQGSLFGEGRMAPLSRAPAAPDPEAIRGRLDRLIGTLRDATAMPLSDRDARMWQTVVPNMTKWLPTGEAEAVRAAFTREMERLGAAAGLDERSTG